MLNPSILEIMDQGFLLLIILLSLGNERKGVKRSHKKKESDQCEERAAGRIEQSYIAKFGHGTDPKRRDHHR